MAYLQPQNSESTHEPSNGGFVRVGFFQELKIRVKAMLSFQAALPGLISISFLVAMYFIANNKLQHTWAADYIHLINIAIGIGFTVVVLRSASYSLILPIAFLTMGLFSTYFAKIHISHFHLTASLAVWVLLLGIASMIKSAMVIC